MTDMREKIARAIAAQKMGLSNRGERLPEDLWWQALPIADAVLDAMREPTPKMIEAGGTCLDEAPIMARPNEDAEACWDAMIDAAKGE